VLLSNSFIQANSIALRGVDGAATFSYGNNDINDNGAFGLDADSDRAALITGIGY